MSLSSHQRYLIAVVFLVSASTWRAPGPASLRREEGIKNLMWFIETISIFHGVPRILSEDQKQIIVVSHSGNDLMVTSLCDY
jgi:hypothetical protein